MSIFSNVTSTIRGWFNKPVKKETITIEPVENTIRPVKINTIRECERKPPVKIIRGKGKVNWTNTYWYYAEPYKMYFKTKKGKRSIPITGKEAIMIVSYLKDGYSITEIYNMISWEHDTLTEQGLKNWVNKYNLGLMDYALAYICNRNVEGMISNKEHILHKYIGDL